MPQPHLEIVKPDALGAQPVANLQVELRAALERFNALDARHRIAKEIHGRAEHALHEATEHAEQLKSEMDAAVELPPKKAAKRFAEAAAHSGAVLGLALSRRDTLELSARELAAERAKVAEEAAAAADRLADDILDAEGYEIGDDVISSMQLHWKLLERRAPPRRPRPPRASEKDRRADRPAETRDRDQSPVRRDACLEQPSRRYLRR